MFSRRALGWYHYQMPVGVLDDVSGNPRAFEKIFERLGLFVSDRLIYRREMLSSL